MGMYLNRSNDSFKTDLEGIFVDKSDLISILNKRINTKNRFICITRARRFGKTVNANMIDAYYSKGCDSKELFDGLSISKDKDYETHLNKYNVIHIDVAKFLNAKDKRNDNPVPYEEFIDYMERCICEELYNEFPSLVIENAHSIANAVFNIYSKTGTKFIILLDEWDAPLRVDGIDEETRKEYIELLRSLFKVGGTQDCFSLGYLTGIIPIKKTKGQSALNNFRESTMITSGPFAPYYGFTKDEVVKLCNENNMNYENVESWYDGYTLRESDEKIIHIFNPNSISECMSNRILSSYWGQSAYYEVLQENIEENYDGLRNDIISAISGSHVRVNTTKSENYYNNFKGKDDVLTQLIHLGYLTYDGDSKECYIPNYEVLLEFENAIEESKDNKYKIYAEIINSSYELLEDTWKMNEEEVCNKIKKVHEECASIFKYKDENSLSCVLNFAYIAARDEYVKIMELSSGAGFADIAFLPKAKSTRPAMIVELKYNESFDKAHKQIIDKDYISKAIEFNGECLTVALSFDKGRGKYSCKIEKYKK